MLSKFFPIYAGSVSAAEREALHRDFVSADRMMVIILALHWLIAASLTAYTHGTYVFGIVAGGVTTLAAVSAVVFFKGSVFSRTVVGIAFMVYSAIFIMQHHGRIEMHFHVFVALAVLIRYKDIVPLLAAAGTIAVHHVAFNFLQLHGLTVIGVPLMVFSYGVGMQIVMLHAVFVVAATAVFSNLILHNTHQFFSLVRMAGDVFAVVDNVIKAVENADDKIRKTAEGATRQAEQADQIAAAAEQMGYTIKDIAGNAVTASETSQQAMSMAEEGKTISQGAIENAKKVSAATLDLAHVVEDLNSRAQEIGEITGVIRDIAFKTNLLALNAAVEAARAGDHGRGFAVVADEVRDLAIKTTGATHEISEKIKAVQQDSEATKNSMKEAAAQVSGTMEYIQNMGKSLTAICDTIRHAQAQVAHIATAVEEQSAMTNDVIGHISETSSIAKRIEGMSADVLAQVDELARLAGRLQDSARSFKSAS